ncbi:hypothetical protein [Aquirhabdus parva]|uniref:Uncharacterized protein n=1 Tax=Aquirhabdus parva TaxID=2283318 RepID=A0A345P5T6_9GAMM|nr:hypothetical protein [Aquirhabdus parva]AXI02645.1 hypothetical protein HYN46_07270 [Aquirhabdus parva]
MTTVNSYLKKQLNYIDFGSLWAPRIWKRGVKFISFFTLVPIPVVLFSNELSVGVTKEYFDNAIAEANGPHLWNIAASAGFLLFAALFLFPRSVRLAGLTKFTLDNALAVGALSLGVIIGQVLTALMKMQNISSNQLFTLFALTFFGSIYIFSANFILWYCSKLTTIRNQSAEIIFLTNINGIDIKLRLVAFLIVLISFIASIII